MAEHPATQHHALHATEWLDALSMVAWKISAVVIGLQLVIVVPVHPRLLSQFAQVGALLLKSALALAIIGLLRLLWPTARGLCQRWAGQAAPPLAAVRRSWCARAWPIALAIDCALAAAIIPLAVTLAVQERVDWRGVAGLALIGIVRVALQERCQQARAAAA